MQSLIFLNFSRLRSKIHRRNKQQQKKCFCSKLWRKKKLQKKKWKKNSLCSLAFPRNRSKRATLSMRWALNPYFLWWLIYHRKQNHNLMNYNNKLCKLKQSLYCKYMLMTFLQPFYSSLFNKQRKKHTENEKILFLCKNFLFS